MTNKEKPPLAEKHPHSITFHNHIRTDEYYWLNQRENPDVISYLEEENRYLDKKLSHLKNLRQTLYKEMVNRIVQDDSSVPYLQNGYYYYIRYSYGNEHPVYCRKKNLNDSFEEIILDVNTLAKNHSYFQVTGVRVSPDNQKVAYAFDDSGRRIYTICIKNLVDEKEFNYRINNTNGLCEWANDSKTLFYSQLDKTLRPAKIFRHTININPEKDKEIFYEEDSAFSCFVSKSKSKDFIYIYSTSTIATECRLINANKPKSSFKVFHPRENDHRYFIYHDKDGFYVLSNYKAKNYRIFKTPVNKTIRKNWQEIIAHREDVLIQDIEIFKDFIVIDERKNALNSLRVIHKYFAKEYNIPFDEPACVVYLIDNREADSNILRYTYSSMITPDSVFDFDLVDKTRVLRKEKNPNSPYNKVNYKTQRLFVKSTDGSNIPLSLVYRKDTLTKTGNPLLLYGYGSYGISIDPEFNPVRLSLLDRGFIFAVAHIRGGDDLGMQWYEDGKLLKKKNTFTDFIECAEELIRLKYTSQEKLFAMGGSAGGLLIGAVTNMRPELWKAVIADVPFLDVLTTMLDESIPLTTFEFDEWGNPKLKRFYDYILSYSPYDNIEEKEYPAMLLTAGFHDSQVQYWEPAKFVARLRQKKKDDNLLLLHTEMETGHGGASGRFAKLKEIALKYAFLLDQTGVNK